ALCHSTTDEAKQGPGLGGIVGRKAGGGRFSYTKAMRDSGLTWDQATLDRFLKNPVDLVPGTTMPMPLPDDTERHAVIAYLATLPAVSSGAAAAAPPAKAPLVTSGDYAFDTPGARHKLTVADLPAPFATSSARNSPTVVDRPSGAMPRVLPGF